MQTTSAIFKSARRAHSEAQLRGAAAVRLREWRNERAADGRARAEAAAGFERKGERVGREEEM